jgi:endoglucanase
MKRIKLLSIVFGLAVSAFILWSATDKYEGVVSKHGMLTTKGRYVVDKNGEPLQLRGMSLFWSQWDGARFFNKKLVRYMAKGWKSGIIRAVMGVDMGGYLQYPDAEKQKVQNVIEGAIKSDIYVLVDYHAHYAQRSVKESCKFFGEIAKQYGHNPHVIYEIYNEPLCSWDSIKWYAEQVIDTIRKYDPDNMIIVGTPRWSQKVDNAADNPIKRNNIAYTLHFYAATHKQELRDIADYAIKKDLPIFVTEFGTVPASGNGPMDLAETEIWMKWMDDNKISWCNWSICDKNETASAVTKEALSTGNWIDDIHLTPSGRYVKKKIMEGKY